MSYLPLIIQIALIALAVSAAIFDLRARRVPNWLNVSGVLAGLAVHIALSGTEGLWFSLKGLGLALAVYVPLFVLRAMGAGDAKLMAAIGAMVGWANWLGIMILTSIIGGLIALVLIAAKGRVRRTFQNVGLLLIALRMRQAPHQVTSELDVGSEDALRLPHAVSIFLGVVTYLIVAALWAPR